MIRLAVLVAALALPGGSGADQIWRWADSAGRLHYSNVAEHVPAHAEPLRGSIGTVRMQPLPRPAPVSTRRLPVTEPSTVASPRGHRGGHHRHAGGCCGFGSPFGPVLNSTDPSELARQASVLDALGIRWRNGGCE